MLANLRPMIFFSCSLALLLLAFYHSTLYRDSLAGRKPVGGSWNHATTPELSQASSPLEATIRQLFSSVKHPDFVSEFIDPAGTSFTHNNSIWTESLGKDLLIVDVDTRYPEQMFDSEMRVDWEHLGTDNLVTEAVFNHYLYATIHGYDYKYYRPEPVPGHHKTWPKVHSMHNLLPHYKFVIFLDADASFRHLNLPFEWLLNRWNVTPNTSFTMARDPLDNDCNLCDSNGVPMTNTGFVVVQNLPYTEEIFEAWLGCTTGERYAGCEKWKNDWAHEQAVFSDYLRYDFNPDGDNIRELECGEANGFPGHGWYDPVECNGKFVRHHTFVKDMTKTTTANTITQAFIDIIKTNLGKVGKDVVVSEKAEQVKQVVEEEKKQQKQEKRELETGDGNEPRGNMKATRIIHEPVRRRTVD